jgi:GNAT superfamily N-acetyltransferase
MPLSIRLMDDADLGIAGKILSSAFQRSGDWTTDLLLYRRIQPDGYFLAELDGNPVGMVGTTVYPSFAYVGMMAVLTTYQRQGIGLALMEYLLDWLDRQKVPMVLLDASPSGQSLYERLGFVAYKNVEILQRSAGQPFFPCPKSIRPVSVSDLDRLSVDDTNAFGGDRSRVLCLLLETYPGRAFLFPDRSGQINGYLFAQANRLGPWVMQTGEDAEELLQAALSLPYAGPISVAVPEENAGAFPLLKRYGFEPIRVNRHMGRGSGAPAGERGKIFGQTSLSLG